MKETLMKLLNDNGIKLKQFDGYYRIVPVNEMGRIKINRSESVGGYNCFYGNYFHKSYETLIDQINYFINYKNNCNIKIQGNML